MSQERKPLLHQLKETVQIFSERGTVGRMKTEHVVFIPTQLMVDQATETAEFIKAARDINSTVDFRCSVLAEVRKGKYPGVEFIFQFGPETDYKGIIEEIEERL